MPAQVLLSPYSYSGPNQSVVAFLVIYLKQIENLEEFRIIFNTESLPKLQKS
jgi:hypothetical protein